MFQPTRIKNIKSRIENLEKYVLGLGNRQDRILGILEKIVLSEISKEKDGIHKCGPLLTKEEFEKSKEWLPKYVDMFDEKKPEGTIFTKIDNGV